MPSPFLIAATVLSIQKSRSSSDSFQKFLTGYLPRASVAIERMDPSFFDKMFAADFTEKEGGKDFTRAESLAKVHHAFTGVKALKCQYELLSATSNASGGVALTHMTTEATLRPDASGLMHRVKAQNWQRETFVHYGTTWKVRSMVEVKPIKVWVDGKRVDQQGKPKH